MGYERKFNTVVISSSLAGVIIVFICGLIITNCSSKESLYRVTDNSIESAVDSSVDSEVASISSEVSEIVSSIKPREDSKQSIVSKAGVNKERQVVSHTFIDNTSKVQQSSEEDIFQMSLPIKIVEPSKHSEASQVSSRGTASETSKVSSIVSETSKLESSVVNETSKLESRGTTSEVSSGADETSKVESNITEPSEVSSSVSETSVTTEISEVEQSQSSYEESIEPLDVKYAYFDYDFEQQPDIPDNYEVKECYEEWGMTKLDNIDGAYTFDEIIDIFNEITSNDCQVADYDTVCAYFNDKMASDSAFAKQMYMSNRADILLENGVFKPQSHDITMYTIIPNMFSHYVVYPNQDGVGNFEGGASFCFYSNQEDKQGYIDEFKTVLKDYLQDGISEMGYKYIYSCFRDGQLMICMFDEFDYIGEAKG